MSEQTIYSGMSNSVHIINATLIELRDLTKNIYDLTKHIHDSHWHGTTHCVEEFDNIGSAFVDVVDESSLLMNEFNNRLDKDGNELIFGFDFIIDKEDINCPPSLRSVESSLIYDNMDIPEKISWEKYKSTLPWNK